MQRSRQLYRRVLDFGERSAYGQATSKALYGDAALDTEEGNYKQAIEQNRGYPRLKPTARYREQRSKAGQDSEQMSGFNARESAN
ncbi:hypothetical protein [Thermoleptolyngbya sp.]